MPPTSELVLTIDGVWSTTVVSTHSGHLAVRVRAAEDESYRETADCGNDSDRSGGSTRSIEREHTDGDGIASDSCSDEDEDDGESADVPACTNVYSLDDGKCVHAGLDITWSGMGSTAVELNDGTGRIVSIDAAGAGNVATCWNLATGNRVSEWSSERSKDRFDADGGLLWGRPLMLALDAKRISALAAMADGAVASLHADGSVSLWRVEDGSTATIFRTAPNSSHPQGPLCGFMAGRMLITEAPAAVTKVDAMVAAEADTRDAVDDCTAAKCETMPPAEARAMTADEASDAGKLEADMAEMAAELREGHTEGDEWSDEELSEWSHDSDLDELEVREIDADYRPPPPGAPHSSGSLNHAEPLPTAKRCTKEDDVNDVVNSESDDADDEARDTGDDDTTFFHCNRLIVWSWNGQTLERTIEVDLHANTVNDQHAAMDPGSVDGKEDANLEFDSKVIDAGAGEVAISFGIQNKCRFGMRVIRGLGAGRDASVGANDGSTSTSSTSSTSYRYHNSALSSGVVMTVASCPAARLLGVGDTYGVEVLSAASLEVLYYIAVGYNIHTLQIFAGRFQDGAEKQAEPVWLCATDVNDRFSCWKLAPGARRHLANR